ncbi:MAG: SPOR domain-containing protein [Bacteroidota bacterium]|nr:SPOR domain-containing protein [Bacteroidota bacterium]
MTTTELARRLLAEGCNPDTYAIDKRSYDGFCLLHNGRGWAVFYSERGRDQEPVFISLDEDAACQYFFDFVMRQEHRHLVGCLRSEPAAQAVWARLQCQGIATHVHRLFYAKNDYRQVIGVVGKDVFRARALLGRLPVEDGDEGRPGFWTRLRQRFA